MLGQRRTHHWSLWCVLFLFACSLGRSSDSGNVAVDGAATTTADLNVVPPVDDSATATDPPKTNCVIGANGQEECAPAPQDNDTAVAAPDLDDDDTSNCVIGADGSMECPPAAQDDPEPFQPESHSEDFEDDEDEELDEFMDQDQEADEFEHENNGEETAGSLDVNEADIEDCTDQHEQCAFWASLVPSECTENPAYMLLNCPHSCKSCQIGDLSVPSPDNGHTRLYGKRQSGSDEGTLERIESMHRYMTETVFVNESYTKVKAEVRVQPYYTLLELSLFSLFLLSSLSIQ
jgi:ShK domain-like